VNDEIADSKTRTAAAKALLAAEREFVRRGMGLVDLSIFAVGLSAGAQRHIREGFARRVLLIEANRMTILEIASPERKENLSSDEAAELNVALNSFYVELRGAMDNLAWALHYEYKLLGEVDEDEVPIRARCQLFDSRSLDPLDTQNPELSKFLRGRLEWAKEFKELRDPVAHRIPIYAVPGVAFPADVEKIRELEAEANRAAQAGDLELSFSKLREARTVGGYQPVFATSGPQGLQIRGIHESIQEDQRAFLEVSETVLAKMKLRVSE
jgi:hypothetical protein